jgi:nucleoside transporter
MSHPRDSLPDPTVRSPLAIRVRMAAMMFLQYWPLGVWGVTVGTYIAANTGGEGARMFSAGFAGYSTAAGAIGGLISPVLMGYLSDRYFSAQRLTSVMNVGCAVAAWRMYECQTQVAFFFWLLVYFQCFVPAATLTNKIALRHLANPDAEYPRIRIFGTLGWIGSGLFVGYIWPTATGEPIEATRLPLLLGASGSVLMALYSLTLPHTPPERAARSVVSPTFHDSGNLLRNRPLVVFLLVSMLACIPSMAYNNLGNLFLNRQAYPHPAALMTLGQVSDLLFLWLTPWLITYFGLRNLFVTGVIAWAARYVWLAAASYYDIAWPVYAAILIHGPCYVFVYVIAILYVDRLADPAHRGAAQGMLALASTGVGHLLGALTAGFAQEAFLTPAGVSPAPYHWTAFWSVFASISLVALLALKIAFPRPVSDGKGATQ